MARVGGALPLIAARPSGAAASLPALRVVAAGQLLHQRLGQIAERGEHLRGAISFSPSVDYMERAYDDAKYGHFSRKPYIDMIIPTLVDPTMAPPGKHVVSCFVQYAPYKLAPELGTWDDQREAFGDAVVDTSHRDHASAASAARCLRAVTCSALAQARRWPGRARTPG